MSLNDPAVKAILQRMSVDDIRIFCYDYFPKLYDQLPLKINQSTAVKQLLDYVASTNQVEKFTKYLIMSYPDKRDHNYFKPTNHLQWQIMTLVIASILVVFMLAKILGIFNPPVPPYYITIVKNKVTGEIITYTPIFIKFYDEITLTDTTDVNGKAVINIPNQYQNQPFKLLVKPEGFLSYAEYVELDGKPHTILLEPIVTPVPTSTNPITPPFIEDTSTSVFIALQTATPNITTPYPPPPVTKIQKNFDNQVESYTTNIPTGKLAIPLRLGIDSQVYITAFDGEGVNGKDFIIIRNAKQPIWTPDGGFVIVNAQIEEKQEVFKYDPLGLVPKVIIPRGTARWSVLSPDGNEIIFSEETLQNALFRQQPNGDFTQILFNNRYILAKQLLWSDDNILVFQACNTWEVGREGECGIWMTSASNLNPQRVIEGPDDFPMDAKSGKLAFMNAKDGDWDVYIMPLTGSWSQAINLTNNTAQDGMPAISPDGKLVAYISNESGSWAIWTVTVAGTDKKKWFDIDPQRGTVDVQTWVDDRMSWSR